MREDIIQKGLIKARKVFDRMIGSRDMEYTADTAQITKSLSIKFECQRNDTEHPDYRGDAICFEIYAVKDGKEVDCCTLHYAPGVNAELLYLLNCYV